MNKCSFKTFINSNTKRIFFNCLLPFGFLFLFSLFFSYEVYARDLVTSFQIFETEAKRILMVLSVLSVMIAGGAYFFSKRFGSEMLTSALIGIFVFASASTLFTLIYNSFH